MTEEELKVNVAKNLTKLRKNYGITQSELGEKLTYSDKSVSKWERGEGLPDLVVLTRLSELYGVTVNDIIGEEITEKEPEKNKALPLSSKVIIPLLSVGLVFLVASLAFFALKIASVDSDKLWLIFLYALPVGFIPSIVFSCLWGGFLPRGICVSGLIWSLVVCLRLTFDIHNMNFIFISAGILQLLVILWFIMRWRSEKAKKRQ